MATEYIGLPSELVEKVKEAAAREEITPEELVRGAVENRLSRAESELSKLADQLAF